MKHLLLTTCLLMVPVVAVAQTYESLTSDGDLLHRWNGDANGDDTGDLNDAVGALNGSAIDTVTYGTAPADKGDGKSFDFGARAGHIELSGEITNGSQCSFTAWFKLTGGTATAEFTVVSDFDGTTTNDGFLLRYDSTQNQWEPHVYAADSGGVFNFSDTTPDDAGWHFVACTMGASEIRLYIDGTEIGTGQALSTLPDAKDAAVANIGNSPHVFSVDEWYGELFDVRYYDRELSSAEVTALYNGPSTGNPLLLQLLLGQ